MTDRGVSASETLGKFLTIADAQVAADLKSSASRLSEIELELASLVALPATAKTPEVEARLVHLFLLQAHAVCSSPFAAPEVKVFYAASAAGQLSDPVLYVSIDKDPLKSGLSAMEELCRREITSEDEWSTEDDAPAGYFEIRDNVDEKLAKIDDTMFVFVLRRYGFTEQADLFERDPMAIDIAREIGRRVLYSPDTQSVEDVYDAYIEREYGAGTLAEVKSRAAKLRRQRNG
jgi:hypothetical protein